jgi:hypothetical protein
VIDPAILEQAAGNDARPHQSGSDRALRTSRSPSRGVAGEREWLETRKNLSGRTRFAHGASDAAPDTAAAPPRRAAGNRAEGLSPSAETAEKVVGAVVRLRS